jgi:hypothetical protein
MEITMQTNQKDYDTRASWVPQQYQPYEGRYVTTPSSQQRLPRPQQPGLTHNGVGQKPRAPEKMPKARAMALANRLKRGLAIASLVGFGAFGGLVALHQVGTTSTQSSTNSSSNSSSSSQNSNSLLNQQGGNTSGTSSSSTSSSSSSTVSGTHTS